ncbi:tyrosine-type recombinase/integrase [Phreatobacter oligotrophus]|uniref:Site-specific recombinase XerD n=1 Tax=Phreatobacter oligotrophus TaxID=1122261 RepID=A0A2T4YLD8_9HYPH|nr:site-specific integrase [Phreatobacter oligotrophus]PTM43838.1 site-specific recombinase XerD [Phreatobacter oligotrophus]
MPKLTKRTIDAFSAEGPRSILWDTELRGFGVLALSSGIKSFIVQYRNAAGRSRRLTLGRYGALTADQGRHLARQTLAQVAQGEDPLADRQEKRAAETMADLFDRYLEDHVRQHNAESTYRDVARLVEKHLKPRLGALKVKALTSADVARLHSAMRATPRRANHAVAILSKALSLAEVWKLRPENSNPCGTIARFSENKRKRFLTMEEVTRLGAALKEAETIGLPWRQATDLPPEKAKHRAHPENQRTPLAWQVVATVRILLLTGARLSEVLGLRRADVDFAAGTLALPSRKGGPREPHPVSAACLDIIRSLPMVKGSPWLLPRPANRERHITKEVMEAGWQRLRDRAGIPDVRLHDLRHTVGTYAGQSGVSAFIVRDLLRHSNISMSQRYVSFDANPVRGVAEIVGARILEGLDPQPADDPDNADDRK